MDGLISMTGKERWQLEVAHERYKGGVHEGGVRIHNDELSIGTVVGLRRFLHQYNCSSFPAQPSRP
jgi:hypothetical protein